MKMKTYFWIKEPRKELKLSQPAYEHPEPLCAIRQMKTECIILMVIFCFGLGCRSRQAIKLPSQQYTNSLKITLANLEFYDGMIFSNAGMDGHSYRYKFIDTSYQKFIYAHYSEPYMTYLVESGDYEMDVLTLTFKPKAKLLCNHIYLGENVNCSFRSASSSLYEYFYVNSDTLTEFQIKELGFLPRTTRISIEDKRMVFKDPSMPKYIQFQQILQ